MNISGPGENLASRQKSSEVQSTTGAKYWEAPLPVSSKNSDSKCVNFSSSSIFAAAAVAGPLGGFGAEAPATVVPTKIEMMKKLCPAENIVGPCEILGFRCKSKVSPKVSDFAENLESRRQSRISIRIWRKSRVLAKISGPGEKSPEEP